MTNTFENVSTGFKFDGSNFPVWERIMRINVGSRGKIHHLEGDEDPPKADDPKFKIWQEADFTVFSWLIQNMDQKLVIQFAQHQTAKEMWKSLNTTFGIRADPVQVYDLEIKANKLVQGNESLESYWSDLQNLWVNTDARKPCPYDCCDKAINTYRKEQEIKRLYQFLAGLDDKYDNLGREMLKDEPTAETAFGIIKQEEARAGIWRPTAKPTNTDIGAGFGARQGAPSPQFGGQNRATQPPPPHRGPLPPPQSRNNSSNRRGIDKSKLYCTHCGMTKHTKETCFKLVGFPEWWEDGHKLNRSSTGKGKMAVGREEGNGFVAPTDSQGATHAGNDGGGSVEVSTGGRRVVGCEWRRR